MREIEVTFQEGQTYLVTVQDGSTRTAHAVTVWPSDVQRYAPETTPEQLIEASFEFLLDREPQNAILTRFELPLIERYFPDYRSRISEYLPRSR
jgi:hypothetical protein